MKTLTQTDILIPSTDRLSPTREAVTSHRTKGSKVAYPTPVRRRSFETSSQRGYAARGAKKNAGEGVGLRKAGAGRAQVQPES